MIEKESSEKKGNVVKLTISMDDGSANLEPTKSVEGNKEKILKDEGYLLELANLVTENVLRNTEHGKTSVRIIQFREETQRQKIIHLLVDNFTETVWKIIPLIRKLGAHPHADVRARVSRTAGELLTELDFIRIKDELLIPWALSPSMDISMNVGLALKEAARDEKFTENIKALLKHWITSSNPDLNWTALACFTQLHYNWTEEALDTIEKALRKTNNIPYLPLCSYLTSEMCKNGHQEEIIQKMVELLREDNEDGDFRFGAAVIFVDAIEFQFIVENPRLFDKTVEIIKIGLSDRKLDNLGIVRTAMLEKLRAWAEGSFDQSSQPELTKIITRLFLRSDERGKERIRFTLQKWHRESIRHSNDRLINGFQNLIAALPE